MKGYFNGGSASPKLNQLNDGVSPLNSPINQRNSILMNYLRSGLPSDLDENFSPICPVVSYIRSVSSSSSRSPLSSVENLERSSSIAVVNFDDNVVVMDGILVGSETPVRGGGKFRPQAVNSSGGILFSSPSSSSSSGGSGNSLQHYKCLRLMQDWSSPRAKANDPNQPDISSSSSHTSSSSQPYGQILSSSSVPTSSSQTRTSPPNLTNASPVQRFEASAVPTPKPETSPNALVREPKTSPKDPAPEPETSPNAPDCCHKYASMSSTTQHKIDTKTPNSEPKTGEKAPYSSHKKASMGSSSNPQMSIKPCSPELETGKKATTELERSTEVHTAECKTSLKSPNCADNKDALVDPSAESVTRQKVPAPESDASLEAPKEHYDDHRKATQSPMSKPETTSKVQEWIPEDDSIQVILPFGLSSQPQTREAVDEYITGFLSGPARRRRLPVFEKYAETPNNK